MPSRAPTALLVVFMDLTRYSAQSQRTPDAELADTVDAYYERVASAVTAAGGIVVKFIGDAALAVFPENAVDAGVAMLLDLKPALDGFFAQRGWECRFNAKAHFGTVIAGDFGSAGAKRFDVIGRDVNTTAILASTGVTLSVEAFRKLGPAMRKHFRKHTPPVTYIRAEDPRPFRARGGRPVTA